MIRDLKRFPNTENGDVLWGLCQQGIDLSGPKEICFSVVFPDEDGALKFAVRFLRNGYKVQVGEYEDQPEGLTWDVSVYNEVAPTDEEITQFERLLQENATPLGGKNDGWGFGGEPA